MTSCTLHCPANKRYSKNVNSHPRIHTRLQCDPHLPSVLTSTVPQDKLFALASGCGSWAHWAQSHLLELSPLPEDVHPLSDCLYKSFWFIIACLLGSHYCFPEKKTEAFRDVGNRLKSLALNSQTGLSCDRDLWACVHLECTRLPRQLLPPCLLPCYDSHSSSS